MRCKLKCEKPGEIEYTLSVTMTASDWQKLNGQLEEATHSYYYPIQDLRNQIRDLLAQASKVYSPTETVNG